MAKHLGNGERAQTEPAAEVRSSIFAAVELDRTCGDRVGETQAAKPYRGQGRLVRIDRELHIEALIDEAQIHRRGFDEGLRLVVVQPGGRSDLPPPRTQAWPR